MWFEGYEKEGYLVPTPADEIALIAHYGARTLAVTINSEDVTPEQAKRIQTDLANELSMPVIDPLSDGVDSLIPVINDFVRNAS